VAALSEGFEFIGVEVDPEYVQIARARLAHAERATRREMQLSLFDQERSDR
jgi:DNA modification methylase